jgi:hypothetical protein
MLQAMTGQVVSHLAFEVTPNFGAGWGVLTTGRGEVLSDPSDVAMVCSLGLGEVGQDDVLVRIPTEILVGYELLGPPHEVQAALEDVSGLGNSSR